MKHPECNAGIIFDNLASKYYPDELIGLKIIMAACNNISL